MPDQVTEIQSSRYPGVLFTCTGLKVSLDCEVLGNRAMEKRPELGTRVARIEVVIEVDDPRCRRGTVHYISADGNGVTTSAGGCLLP